MSESFAHLWDTAPAVLGWAFIGSVDQIDLNRLVQVRGAYQQSESVILLQTETSDSFAEILPVSHATLMAEAGALHSGTGDVDHWTGGTRVSVVPGTDELGGWRTNGGHAAILLDRIAASELDPDDDLLRCLRGTPSSAERLATIDLDAVRRLAGEGREPTATERWERILPLLTRESTAKAAVEAFDKGDNERGMKLMEEVGRLVQEAMERRREEFGES